MELTKEQQETIEIWATMLRTDNEKKRAKFKEELAKIVPEDCHLDNDYEPCYLLRQALINAGFSKYDLMFLFPSKVFTHFFNNKLTVSLADLDTGIYKQVDWKE